MSNKSYYFVYGTLKKGHGNHRILENCKKVGDFVTKPEYTMIHLGGFPGVIKGGNTAIKGELYEVEDKETELRLDRLEGYYPGGKHNLYDKETIKIDNKDAFIYIFNTDGRNLVNYKEIESGKW